MALNSLVDSFLLQSEKAWEFGSTRWYQQVSCDCFIGDVEVWTVTKVAAAEETARYKSVSTTDQGC